VEQADEVGSMSDKHDIGWSLGSSLAGDCLFVESIRSLVDRAEQVVVDGHEETEVCVHTAVVQRMVAWGVDQVLHSWDSHEPPRNKLEIAVTNGVQDVKGKKVDVEH